MKRIPIKNGYMFPDPKNPENICLVAYIEETDSFFILRNGELQPAKEKESAENTGVAIIGQKPPESQG
jgi:hypothetical protein